MKAASNESFGYNTDAVSYTHLDVYKRQLHPEEGCKAADSCVTKYVWQRINESINQTVDEIKLAQLVEESKKMGCQDIHGQTGCKN